MQYCTGRKNTQRRSALHLCLPRRHHIHRLVCWWQWLHTTRRHHLWIILTIICVCPSPSLGYCQARSWCVLHAHRSLGSIFSYPHDPWCGYTGCSGTLWNRCSRFVWGNFLAAAWQYWCQLEQGLPFLQWCGEWLDLILPNRFWSKFTMRIEFCSFTFIGSTSYDL